MVYQSERLKRLLAALRTECSRRRGRQQMVAFYCQTTPSTVSDWLHARKNPTGEQVLCLLDFLGKYYLSPQQQKPKERNVTPAEASISNERLTSKTNTRKT